MDLVGCATSAICGKGGRVKDQVVIDAKFEMDGFTERVRVTIDIDPERRQDRALVISQHFRAGLQRSSKLELRGTISRVCAVQRNLHPRHSSFLRHLSSRRK